MRVRRPPVGGKEKAEGIIEGAAGAVEDAARAATDEDDENPWDIPLTRLTISLGATPPANLIDSKSCAAAPPAVNAIPIPCGVAAAGPMLTNDAADIAAPTALDTPEYALDSCPRTLATFAFCVFFTSLQTFSLLL